MAELDEVLQQLGIEITRTSGPFRSGRCPFARLMHEKGIDQNPSFSAWTTPRGIDLYCCWACKKKGTINELIYELTGQQGKRTATCSGSWYKKAIPQYHAPGDLEAVLQRCKEIPNYILTRGVTIKTARLWEIGWDKQSGDVVFPVRDIEKTLVGIAYRSIEGKRFRTSRGFRKGRYFYGEHLVSFYRTVVLCEGLVDTLRIHQAGINVIGALGSIIGPEQLKKLRRFPSVIVAPDPDEAGRKMAANIRKALGSKAKVKNLPSDPAELPWQDLLWFFESEE